MAYAKHLTRRDATRLPRRDPTVQLRTDPELRIGPQFMLPDWLLLASWSFGGLFCSFATQAERATALFRFDAGFCGLEITPQGR